MLVEHKQQSVCRHFELKFIIIDFVKQNTERTINSDIDVSDANSCDLQQPFWYNNKPHKTNFQSNY